MKTVIILLTFLFLCGCPYRKTINRPSNCDGNFQYYCDDKRCWMTQPGCRP